MANPGKWFVFCLLLGPLGLLLAIFTGKQCPHCTNRMHENAETCPKCGKPSREGDESTTIEAESEIIPDVEVVEPLEVPEQEAFEFLRLKLRDYREQDREKALSHIYDLLIRKGFPPGVSRNAAMRKWREMEEPNPEE